MQREGQRERERKREREMQILIDCQRQIDASK